MRGYPQVGYRRGGSSIGQPGFQELPGLSAALHGARAAWLLARYGSFIGSAITTAWAINEIVTWYKSEKRDIREVLTQEWTLGHSGPCTIEPTHPWNTPSAQIGASFPTACSTVGAALVGGTPTVNAFITDYVNDFGTFYRVHEAWWRQAHEATWDEVVEKTESRPLAFVESVVDRKRVPWRRPWYLEEAGWTWGMPISTAGYNTLPFARPIVIAPPAPPPPPVDEIKIRVNHILHPIRLIINATSETADMINALFQALPACYRRSVGNVYGPQRKLRHVVRYLHRIANNPEMSVDESCGSFGTASRDTRNAVRVFILHALKNLITEGLIDMAHGIPGNWVAQMSQQLGIPFGLQTILKVIKQGTLHGVQSQP